MLVYVPSSSGSFRYRVTGVYAEKEWNGYRDCIMAEVVRSYYPEVYTADMAGWLAVIELPGQALKGTYYDCVQLPGPGGEY